MPQQFFEIKQTIFAKVSVRSKITCTLEGLNSACRVVTKDTISPLSIVSQRGQSLLHQRDLGMRSRKVFLERTLARMNIFQIGTAIRSATSNLRNCHVFFLLKFI